MTPDAIVAECRARIAEPLAASVDRWKMAHPDGRAVAAYPVWAPAEVIHAAGMLPLALLGGGTSVELTHADAAAVLRAGACGLLGMLVYIATSRWRRSSEARRRGRMSRLRLG